MSEQNIRIGIVGAGTNTRFRHIPGLQALKGVEIVSVCNRSRESSQKVADEYSIAKVYSDWRELVAADDIDAVVIGTWPYLHCSITRAALAADKHILCEARMAMNAREAHEMLAASVAKPHLVAQIVPSPLTLHLDGMIKKMIGEGFLGDVLAVELRQGGAFIDKDRAMSWREDKNLSGLNVMMLGIWYEAILRWIGPARSVCALGRTFIKERRDADGKLRQIYIPDHLDVIAEMECGAQMHMLLSQAMGLLQDEGLYLFGSEGTLRIAKNKLFAAKRGDKEFKEVAIPLELHADWRVEEEFI
ncbi:MAG: Gfo/Idh/MocA family oxidoreductase, partial [Sedimentisphaerales bacterium]|nr:Gfo/Idh/MocA family oxidoreductase [Sedimentisphaerales bacterium]